MKKEEVLANLGFVKTAKEQHARDEAKFQSDVWAVMRRLLHEAAANRMSPEEVAKHSGHTNSRIRHMMRDMGLNPRDGKTLLSQRAAEALATNADLMGIEPSEMDLMSPLAYLPMGEQMRRRLQDASVSQVTDIDGYEETLHTCPECRSTFGEDGTAVSGNTVVLDPEHHKKIDGLVEAAEGIAPMSVESVVGMALDAFLAGAVPEGDGEPCFAEHPRMTVVSRCLERGPHTQHRGTCGDEYGSTVLWANR